MSEVAEGSAPEMAAIQARREEIKRELAEMEMDAVVSAREAAATEVVPEKEDKAEPWPHSLDMFQNVALEYRKPNDSALLSLGMVMGGQVDANLQMKIFNAFLKNHLSASSYEQIVVAMMTPDSPITIEGVIGFLTTPSAASK